MTLLNIKNPVYQHDINNYKFSNPYDDNFHRALNHMEHNRTPIKPIIEPELQYYKIEPIKRIEKYTNTYDFKISLQSNFYNSKIKLDNPSNVQFSKKYDDIPENISFINKTPDAYYQYKLKNKKSSDIVLSNLESQHDVPNELNYLIMNEETQIDIPTLKRENLDRENHLKILLANHEKKSLNIQIQHQYYRKKLIMKYIKKE